MDQLGGGYLLCRTQARGRKVVSSQDPADHPQKPGGGMLTQMCFSDMFSLRLAGMDKCLNIYL